MNTGGARLCAWLGLAAAAVVVFGLACTEAGTEGEALVSVDQFQAGLDDFEDREALPGAALYQEHCASCHNGSVARAPHLVWLEMMTPEALHQSLFEGIMVSQAAALSEGQRIEVIEYLTRRHFRPGDADDLAGLYCEGEPGRFDAAKPPPVAGWGHDTRRLVPAQSLGFSAADVPDLELRWAFVYPGALRARSQPAIAYGAVYVGSYDGRVYALDVETGCVRWVFRASSEVRTGIVPAEVDGRPLVFFGDILARAYAVDAKSGEEVWSLKVDDHPSATLTGTPAFFESTLYVPVSSLEVTAAADPAYPCCTFRGSVRALDAATGIERWVHYSIPEAPAEIGKTSVGTARFAPSGAPIWASPTIDAQRRRIYIGTGENYSSPAEGNSDAVLAIDLDSGSRVWTSQVTAGDAWNVACMMADNPNCPEEDGPDFDLGASLLLVDLPESGRQVIVGGHKDGSVFALDPDAPAPRPLWRTRVGRGSIQGGVHFGLAAEGPTIFVPINDMNDTRNGDFLDPDAARPGVHAVDARSGKVLWSHVQQDICGEARPLCDPGVSAPLTALPGAVVAGHLDGFLRAYDSASGRLLWAFETARPFTGLGGREGRGGGMSGAGPWAGDGVLVVNSGYGLYFHEPGNLLLAFAPKGEKK